MDAQRAPLEWDTVKEFIDGDHVVAVRRARAGRWSRWSLQVGTRRQGQDRISSFVPVLCNREGAANVAIKLNALLSDAQRYVDEEVAKESASAPVMTMPEVNRRMDGGGRGEGGREGGGRRNGGRERRHRDHEEESW
jgi:hypothetical protein